jgi:magnesium transporter
MEFKIKVLIRIRATHSKQNDQQLEVLLNDMHHADIAEILDELDFNEATYIFKVLDSEKQPKFF